MRSKKAIFLLLVIIVALLSSGCSSLLNRRPVIEAISDQIRKVGQEFIYQVIAYDPDNGELTYSLTEKPEGMQIESTTGIINWIPGEDQIGTFNVEVKVSDGNSFNIEKFDITVEDIFLTSIEVSPANINVYVGNSNTITSVTAHYDNGDSIDLSLADCDYTSSDTNIATVNNNGLITGVSAGTAVITVTYTEGGITKTDTVSVTIEDISLASIEVSPTSINIYVGNSSTINSITAFYNDGSNASIALSWATYQSSNTNIAIVNNSGLITGVSTGTAIITISYTEGGITKADMIGVTVSEIPKVLTSITVLPSTMSMYVGNSENITSVTAHYNDGSNDSITLSLATYQSSNTTIATVNNNGLITGVSTGTAVITVSYTEGGITKADMIGVTVSETPKVLISIIVLPSSMTLEIGESKQITSVTAYYDNGTNTNIALNACTYESNKSNATVSSNGVITGVSSCSASTPVTITVSYTEDSITKTDTISVVVTNPSPG